MSIIETIKNDIEGVFDKHAPEIEAAALDAAAVIDSPVAKAAASALHVPSSVLGIIADTISRLDAEFAAFAEAHQAAAADPTAPALAAASTEAGAEPSSDASGPSEASPVYRGNGTGTP